MIYIFCDWLVYRDFFCYMAQIDFFGASAGARIPDARSRRRSSCPLAGWFPAAAGGDGAGYAASSAPDDAGRMMTFMSLLRELGDLFTCLRRLLCDDACLRYEVLAGWAYFDAHLASARMPARFIARTRRAATILRRADDAIRADMRCSAVLATPAGFMISPRIAPQCKPRLASTQRVPFSIIISGLRITLLRIRPYFWLTIIIADEKNVLGRRAYATAQAPPCHRRRLESIPFTARKMIPARA